MSKILQTTPTKKKIFIAIIAILVLGVSVFLFVKKPFSNSVSNINTDSTAAETTSTISSAQPDFSDNTSEENKDPGNTLREDRGTATITDNSGSPSSSTSEPKTSETGEITVYLPFSNGVIKNGQEISGLSTLANVNYRLIDSVTGVIATGVLRVVDGKFSGTMSYETSAHEGRLDIFGTKADTSEFSAVEIPVRFE